MAKTFLISQANPIPFRKLVEVDNRYNTIPFDLQPTYPTATGCYYQKWEFIDATKIQYLSDYADVTIKVYRLGTRIVAGTIVPVEVVTNIENQTFKVYEAQFDFSDYGNGYFFAEITFVDEDLVPQTYQSQAWHTAPKWPDTLLFEYTNSYNNYSVIFETGIIFNFRIEAELREFTPQFDDEIYIDQIHNATQLSSIPSKQFKLVTRSVPDWTLNLLNWVLNVDEKKIDGVYHEKTEGAKFDITRVEGYIYGYGTIDVVPVDNFFLQRLKVGDMADGLFTIITKRLQYIDNAVNRTIPGIFRLNGNLRRIDVINKGLDAFTIKVGTTDGGQEIGNIEFTAADATGVLVVHELFDSDTTIYLTGLTGTQTNLFVIFDQDDEPAVSVNTGVATGLFPKGFSGWFSEIQEGDLEANWDLASGLGKVGTRYANCAIEDGRNGTQNMANAYSTGVDIGEIDDLGTFISANLKKITIGQLPKHKFTVPMALSAYHTQASGPDDQRAFIRNFDNPGTETNELGNDEDFDVRPRSLYRLPFIAITD